MNPGVMGALIPIVAIIGGLSIAAYTMYLRMKARQLMHQERLAMIEKGLAPPPLAAVDLVDFPKPRRSSRHIGVLLVAVGIGLMGLIGFQEGVREGLGVGGLIILIGVGFLLNAMLDRRETSKPGSTGSASEIEPPR